MAIVRQPGSTPDEVAVIHFRETRMPYFAVPFLSSSTSYRRPRTARSRNTSGANAASQAEPGIVRPRDYRQAAVKPDCGLTSAITDGMDAPTASMCQGRGAVDCQRGSVHERG